MGDERSHDLTAAFTQAAHSYRTSVAFRLEAMELTYEELASRVANLAAEIGATSDEGTICCCVHHGLHSAIAMLAAWRAGRTIAPLSPSLDADRLSAMMTHAGATGIIVDSSTPGLSRSDCRVIDLERTSGSPSQLQAAPSSPQRPAIVLYTSGSTGAPKGVVISHKAILFNLRVHTDRLGLTASDRGLWTTTTHTISGISDSMRILLNGGTLTSVDLRTEGLPAVARAVNQFRPTVVHFVPTIFRRLIKLHGSEAHLDALRILHLGGEAVTRHDFDLFRVHCPSTCELIVNLGCTEGLTFRQARLNRDSQWKGVTIPLTDAIREKVVRIVEPGGTQQVAVGEAGEIVIRSEYLADGYWRDDELTQQAFTHLEGDVSEYRTGDLGRFTPDGALAYVGRADDQVKLLGQKVHPLALETALSGLDEVREAAVVTAAAEHGPRLLVFLVGANCLADPEWQTEVQREIGLPLGCEFFVLDQLPVLPNGKVDRPRLSSHEEPGVPAGAADPPRTTTEQRIAELWREVLGVDTIDRATHFFGAGGDSLALIDVVAKVAKELGPATPTDLIRNPRLSAFAEVVDRQIRDADNGGQPATRLDVIQHSDAGGQVLLVHLRGAVPYQPHLHLLADRTVRSYEFGQLLRTDSANPSIESVVDDYFEHQGRSAATLPDTIIGFSFNGVVAYAIAQQIEARLGVSPQLLLIEPVDPPRGGHGRWHAVLAALSSRWSKQARGRRWSYRQAKRRQQDGEELTPSEHWALIRPLLFRCRDAYRPLPFGGELLLAGRRERLEAKRHWQELASHVRTIELSEAATHHDCLQPASARRWIAELTTANDQRTAQHQPTRAA